MTQVGYLPMLKLLKKTLKEYLTMAAYFVKPSNKTIAKVMNVITEMTIEGAHTLTLN